MTEIDNKHYAGFWIRVLASILDSLIMAVPSGLILVFMLFVNNVFIVFTISFILMFYKPIMEYKYGATLGKMALDLRVFSNDGGYLSFTQSMLRSSPWLLMSLLSLYSTVMIMVHPSFINDPSYVNMTTLQIEVTPMFMQTIVSLFVLVSVVVVAFDEYKRGVHDHIAKTYVLWEKK